MQPSLGIDFGKVSFHRFYQLFLPFLPGGTLVLGLVLAYPDCFHRAKLTLEMGHYSRLAMLFFGSYGAGLLLYGFALAVSTICQLIGWAAITKLWPPTRNNLDFSKRVAWRRA